MKKHRNRWVCFILSILIVSAAVLAWVFHQNRMENLYGNGIGPVSEEQVPDFLAGKPAYAMGVNSKGMPVFEDPDAAFAEATMDFQTGIAAIQEQFDLEPFTPSNWEPCKTYGAQIPTEDETLREECMKVSIFWISMKTAFQIHKVKSLPCSFAGQAFPSTMIQFSRKQSSQSKNYTLCPCGSSENAFPSLTPVTVPS